MTLLEMATKTKKVLAKNWKLVAALAIAAILFVAFVLLALYVPPVAAAFMFLPWIGPALAGLSPVFAALSIGALVAGASLITSATVNLVNYFINKLGEYFYPTKDKNKDDYDNKLLEIETKLNEKIVDKNIKIEVLESIVNNLNDKISKNDNRIHEMEKTIDSYKVFLQRSGVSLEFDDKIGEFVIKTNNIQTNNTQTNNIQPNNFFNQNTRYKTNNSNNNLDTNNNNLNEEEAFELK